MCVYPGARATIRAAPRPRPLPQRRGSCEKRNRPHTPIHNKRDSCEYKTGVHLALILSLSL